MKDKDEIIREMQLVIEAYQKDIECLHHDNNSLKVQVAQLMKIIKDLEG